MANSVLDDIRHEFTQDGLLHAANPRNLNVSGCSKDARARSDAV